MAGIFVRSDEWNSHIVMDEPTGPERDVIMRMINDHSFPIDQAIYELRDLTAAASAEDFHASTSRETGHAHDSLYRHAGRVEFILHNLAAEVPHAQQSRLIEFILRLEKCTVPDSNRGGVVGAGKDIFWTGVPWFSESIVNIWGNGSDDNRNEFDPVQENVAAFIAQLFEGGYSGCKRTMDWVWSYTANVFEPNFVPNKRNVRMFCIWLIYATRKLWLDIKGPCEEFKPDFWEGWRRLLSDWQCSREDWFPDEDTQTLILRALDCMDITEAAEN